MAIGCLVLHGLGGSIREVQPLVDRLVAEGHIVSCPVLKGHTGNHADFSGVTYKDWIQSAEDALLNLKPLCDEINVIGFSMGGLIALQLSIRHTVRAVITINTPVYFWNLKLIYKNIVSDLHSRRYDNIRRYLRSSGRLPVPILITFLRLLRKTKKELSLVTTNTLSIQTTDDDVVQSRSVDYLYDHVNAPIKCRMVHNGGGHVVLLSDYAEKITNNICAYVDGSHHAFNYDWVDDSWDGD